MDRREFLKSGAVCAVAGLAGSSASGDAAAGHDPAGAKRPLTKLDAIITASGNEHRRRLQNIAECNRSIRRCLRQHVIGEYLPGQVVYNLGEYPCRKPWDPDEWDARELARLAGSGVELVQVHEEWNDALRLFGGDKFTPVNPAGFRRFVRMVHERGMRLIVYSSTGFFTRADPDFRPEWARGGDLVECYWHCARCSPASAGWRAYLLPRLARILDEYGVDGLYDDLGYVPLHGGQPTTDEVPAFEESRQHDGALNDLLEIVYQQVKRRGGIFKIHYAATGAPAVSTKVYDYLWVGESVRDADQLRQAVKNHAPYVVPCLDMSRARIEREDDLYLHAIPYMQFPLLLGGRPFTGERAAIPGIAYQPEEEDFWTQHCRRIWRHHQAHPDGPHSYGWWDSCPGRPEARPTWCRWFKLYRPMVEAGTAAYLEVTDSDLFKGPLPAGVVASAFANRELYLALANYGHTAAAVETATPFVSCGQAGAAPLTSWAVPPRTLVILRRVAPVSNR